MVLPSLHTDKTRDDMEIECIVTDRVSSTSHLQSVLFVFSTGDKDVDTYIYVFTYT